MCPTEHQRLRTKYIRIFFFKFNTNNSIFFREEEEDKPRPNVYIPPNLRKKTVVDEKAVVDRAADGSEIIETVVVEAPNDVRTDPDGQSSEPEIAKDQPATDSTDATELVIDTNDSGFIECGKNGSDKSDY